MSQPTASEVEDLPTDSYDYEGYEEEGFEEEEAPTILYSEDFISRPFIADNSLLPEDILEFDFSFSYDCKRFYNLVCMEESIVVWASGNLIHFYNVETKELWFRRSFLGGGIGHITRNPNEDYPHLTIAENGDKPPIIVYEWPSLDIICVLKDGAAKRYAHVNYNPNGELLSSQSYAPDFLITIWNWKRSRIILRVKSHVIDVDRVMFSPYVPGHISTGGTGHIKFWKMAQTFTGLKLQGELGRFGKTEISDMLGIYPMPDEKVLSGSEWGNILVWEAGLIKVEVFRTMRRKCHDGPIVEFQYVNGEVWTVSMDGWCRAWNYKFIDDADPPDDDRVVQVIVSYERETPGVQFMCITKKNPFDEEDAQYYAQDGNGGIWLIDLALNINYQAPVQLYKCHSGGIADIAACPYAEYIISLGKDGRLMVYNYVKKLLLFIHQFKAKGVKMEWVPLKHDSSGSTLIMAFDDGVIRIVQLCHLSHHTEDSIHLKVIQTTKPHNKPITCFEIDKGGKLLVSASEDKTIFIYCIRLIDEVEGPIQLVPIGFVPVPSIVQCLTWHPQIQNSIFLGLQFGEVLQFDVPEEPVDYTEISYLLDLTPTTQKFTTCKSQIRRDLKIAEIQAKKDKKLQRKREELAQIQADNPGLEIDEDAFLQDSESEEELEPLYFPEIPNKVCLIIYTPEDTLWLSMGGYDAGYIYEYTMDQKQDIALKSTIIQDGDDIELHQYLFTHDKKYVIIAFENGAIRLCRVNKKDFRDLSDYWQLSMHDNYNGRINRMCFSHDLHYFFTCGNDGNIFSYKYNPEDEKYFDESKFVSMVPDVPEVEVEDSYESLSLEEAATKAEYDKQMRLANEHKDRLRRRLADLQKDLTCVMEQNCDLPKSQRLSLTEFVIDDRIIDALEEHLQAKIDLEKRKLAYDLQKSTIGLEKLKAYFTDPLDIYPIIVYTFLTNESVYSIKHRGPDAEFYELEEIVQRKLIEEELKGRAAPRKMVTTEAKIEIKRRQGELEPFLVGLSPSTIAYRLGAKLTRMLNKYRDRKAAYERRQQEWSDMNARKPVEGVNHPDDEKALDKAEKTIGDFKLKSADDYKVPKDQKVSTVKKYHQLLNARDEAYELRHMFNLKVHGFRDKKAEVIEKLKEKRNRLLEIQEELPLSRVKDIPEIPEMYDADFPERNLDVVIKLTKRERKQKKLMTVVTPTFKDLEKDMLGLENRLFDVHGDIREICRKESVRNMMLSTNINILDLIKVSHNDSIRTTWEHEIMIERLIRLLIEQDEIIAEMHKLVTDFDDEIRALAKDKIELQPNGTLLDLHILLLHQEVIIIKEFENAEDALLTVVRERNNEMMDMKDSMTEIQNKIEQNYAEIENNNEKIKELQATFYNAAKEDKFWDFLRRIFKKKYKPPKVTNPDESESSSVSSDSTTESDDDDAGSLDSREIGPIRLDENVLPKGCDKELYDYTFELRNDRHEVEKDSKERLKTIESFKKDLEQALKKMKKYELNLKQANDNLETFQRERQQRLNEIMCVISLRLSQVKYLIENETIHERLFTDVLIFSEPVYKQLYKRVNELKVETIQQMTAYKKNKMHLHRMTIDCKHMANKIRENRKKIEDLMKLKFGSVVNIDELEEAILRRLVQELRVAMLNIREEYEKELSGWTDTYGEKQVELKNIIRENTARLEILAMLNQEKAALAQLLSRQSMKIVLAERGELRPDEYFTKDIKKLQRVVDGQNAQIQALKDEIRSLTIKSLPPDPIPPRIALPPLWKEKEEKEEKVSFEYSNQSEKSLLNTLYETQVTASIYDEELKALTKYEIKETIYHLVDEAIKMHNDAQQEQNLQLSLILNELLSTLPTDSFKDEENLTVIADKLGSSITPSEPIELDNIMRQVSSMSELGEEHPVVESIIRELLNRSFKLYIHIKNTEEQI